MIRWLWCGLAHGWSSYKIIAFYSNRTHRYRCKLCGLEWDGT